MTQRPQASATTITFHGVQLLLPAALPFSHQDNCLVLDFSLGYAGKLVIKPGKEQRKGLGTPQTFACLTQVSSPCSP